jgi:hypothetical protein
VKVQWNLKYSYAGKEEHALIYTSQYNGWEIVREISTKKKYGKFAEQKTIFYASELKPIFSTVKDLFDYLKNTKRLENKK